jgi:transcriptional regulator with XRE-family HTH domain
MNKKELSRIVGQRIKTRRKELGMSQTDLALKCGYRNKSTIHLIENGTNGIPNAKLEQLATALQTPLAHLLPNINTLTEYEFKLLSAVSKLNSNGKDFILQMATDAAEIPKYTKKENTGIRQLSA